MEQIRIAIRGQGRSGRDIHGLHLKKDTERFKVVAVVDQMDIRRERAKEEYGRAVYADYKEILGRKDIDLVVNSLPSYLHFPVTKDLLEHGFNVLCEKPFVPTVEEHDILVSIAEEKGLKLEGATVDMLGSAEKVSVNKETTVIVNGLGDKTAIAERVAQIKTQIETTKSTYDKEKLQERLAKLAGGVAVLYIGAPSEVEMKEKKDRVDDALSATRAAVAEGIVPGGGVAYIRCISSLEGMKGDNDDETTGIEIIRRAIEEPLRQIVANAGLEGAVVVQKVKEGTGDFGYNARTDSYENLFTTGVIDPAKVSRVALENAASIAGMFLTTECVIAEKPEPAAPAPAAPGMGGMGGMM